MGMGFPNGNTGKGVWGRERGEGSMGMGLQRWKHEDTVGQLHNYKLYNLWDKYLKVQMDNLHLWGSCAMFALNIPEWYHFHHFWISATVFILLSWQHCAIIILIIVCWSAWILWFCLSFWPFIHYHVCDCELSRCWYWKISPPYIYCSPFRFNKNL